jgi:hypothetical protein
MHRVSDEGRRPHCGEYGLLRDHVPLVPGEEYEDFDSLRGHVAGGVVANDSIQLRVDRPIPKLEIAIHGNPDRMRVTAAGF